MTQMTQIACKCGAVYEVIETKGPCFDQETLRCVLCENELVAWTGSNVGQLRLLRRPETDRE